MPIVTRPDCAQRHGLGNDKVALRIRTGLDEHVAAGTNCEEGFNEAVERIGAVQLTADLTDVEIALAPPAF
ncbi:MAG: hypothetical protein L0Z53_21455 [Acidobacteriales bacterium]|nr:hypothetical protein [Terriglobales bacterium]